MTIVDKIVARRGEGAFAILNNYNKIKYVEKLIACISLLITFALLKLGLIQFDFSIEFTSD